MGREEEVKIIAYRIWEEESYCHGRDVEHWFQAEVLWEELQKDKDTSENVNTKQKQTTKRRKKGGKAYKKD